MDLRRFLKLLRPTPFKIGCLLVLASALLYRSFGYQKPPLLDSLDHRIIDAMFRWRGDRPHTNSVVIVDIDEKSLRRLGQWPWPRNQVAELIQAIQAGQPRVIGIDIVFAEEDRTSPKRYLSEMASLLDGRLSARDLLTLGQQEELDHDLTLGRAVANSRTVLGYVFQMQDDRLKNPFEAPFPSCNIQVEPSEIRYEELALIQAYRAVVNVPSVAQAETEGFFNVFPDPAGTVRKIPLLMTMDGLPYPSLGLEMLRLGQQQPGLTIHVSQQVQSREKGVLGIELGEIFIPTDDRGQATLNFRGGVKTFPYISAVDLLEGRQRELLADKYVLVGTSAAGLLDLRATPYSNVFPGVEVHANFLDNVLARDLFSHDAYTEIGLTYTLIIIGGVVLSGLLAYTGPLLGALAGVSFIAATVAGNYYFFFLDNQLLGVVYPLTTVIAIFLTITLLNYFFEGKEKRFIHHAFGRYVSPQVVNRLIKSPESLTLKGEQKTLSVLFSDIRGFTTISEQLDSATLGRFMNEYLTEMSGVIMKERGTVDKFIGDAVMAIWGAPLTDPEHAVHAVRASLRMLERLRQLRPCWVERGLAPIEIGVGINTGLMSVGNFGSESRFDYTVIGDNVNLASRLEGSNKLYGTNIIISEFTREALGDRFFCRMIDRVRVKGKNQPVTIYEPLLEGEPDAKLKQETETFAEAVELYRLCRFEESRRVLTELRKANPHPLYGLYLQRLELFNENPPPADWDGCVTFTMK